MEKEMIKFTDIDGSEKEAEVVLFFEAGIETKKKYVIYTFNEADETGMIALYSSIMVENEDKIRLENIDSEEEWAMVKDVMKKIIVDWKEA